MMTFLFVDKNNDNNANIQAFCSFFEASHLFPYVLSINASMRITNARAIKTATRVKRITHGAVLKFSRKLHANVASYFFITVK